MSTLDSLSLPVAKRNRGSAATWLHLAVRERGGYATLLRYAVEQCCRPACAVVCKAAPLGSILRAVLGILRSRSLKAVPVYVRVIRLACWFLVTGQGGGRVQSFAVVES
jgi:hypothetical protein